MPAVTPELQGTAASFYNSKEALRYSSCHQTSQMQEELTLVALQLLDLRVSFGCLLTAMCSNLFSSNC